MSIVVDDKELERVTSAKLLEDMSTFYTAFIRSVLTYAAPLFFLCPAKVPKRRVGASSKAGHVYNMLRNTLPAGHRTLSLL